MRLCILFVLCYVAFFRVTLGILTIFFVRVTQNKLELDTFLGTGILGHAKGYGSSLKVMSADIVRSTTIFMKSKGINDYLVESSQKKSNIIVEVFVKRCVDAKWRKLKNIIASKFQFALLSSNYVIIYYESSNEVPRETVEVDISNAEKKFAELVSHDIWITVGSQSEKWDWEGRKSAKLFSSKEKLNKKSSQENTPIIQVSLESSNDAIQFGDILQTNNTVFFFAVKKENAEDLEWHRAAFMSVTIEENSSSVNIEITVRPKEVELSIFLYRKFKYWKKKTECQGTILIPVSIQENSQKIIANVKKSPDQIFIPVDCQLYELADPPTDWTSLTTEGGWTYHATVLLHDGRQRNPRIRISDIIVTGQKNVYPLTLEITYSLDPECHAVFWL